MIAVASMLLALSASGDALFAAGNFPAALAAYRQTISQNPKDAPALARIATLELYQNELTPAARDARSVLTIDAKNATATRVLETVQLRQRVAASASSLGIPPEGVTLPFVDSEPLPLIQVEINGHTANCVLDTGAPDIVLDPQFAIQAGMTITGGQMGVFAGGRTAQVRQAVASSVRAGSILLRDVRVGILPSPGRLFQDRRVDGVVGTMFLSRFLATIDYPHHRLVLRAREGGTGADGVRVPMWLVGDHFLFAKGSVNGLGDQLFIVDSGLAGGGFAPEQQTIAAAHVRTFADQASQGIGGAGAVRIIPVIADTLCLSNACQHDVHGVYSPGGSPLRSFPFIISGAVSHTFLEHYAVTLDFERMEIRLK
ncbi:MAG TPA: aspartyl protease family protein [Candidatus Baltobacteraceae bacterium]|jgi:hypothetical protein|nr:aspartyl protease family protein [Candidatus Baltobacteraceae bacterium]